MNPLVIVAMIQAALEALTELLRFLQTDQGKKLVELFLNDRAKWDAFVDRAGKWFEDLFTGKLFVALEEKKP